MRKEEQPYFRVKAMVDHVLRKRQGNADSPLVGIVQLGHFLRGSALLLRLDLAILSSVIALKRAHLFMSGVPQNSDRQDFVVNLDAGRKDCSNLVISATEGKQQRQMTEGHLLFARYAALEASVVYCSRGRDPPEGQTERVPSINDLKAQGLSHLDTAAELCTRYPGTTNGLQNEVDATKKMLERDFYQPVSNQERREVLAAMASQFSGTGHWYTCANGHPFTIGECGMPMEQTRCPECGAPVGGQMHANAEGVQLAAELDREAAALGQGMDGLRLG